MPQGAAIGLVTALHDLHGEWDLIFFKSAMGCAPLAHSLPLVTISVLHTFGT